MFVLMFGWGEGERRVVRWLARDAHGCFEWAEERERAVAMERPEADRMAMDLKAHVVPQKRKAA